jgi:transketolase
MNRIDELCINTLRFLAVDAVEGSGSGHPGLPLGAAPEAYVLWDRFLKHNPANPHWFDRDRFILSAGHGSTLLYALLHMSGYDLPLKELKRLRRWESMTPGHPEYGLAPGVEVTTGPLGQGFAMAVGMAIGERFLSAYYNRDDLRLIDHYTYVLASDGDLMEGISHEAASLAGHLGLGKLICMYDDNGVSIEGSTQITFTEDVGARFRAYSWQVLEVRDANDTGAIRRAVGRAVAAADWPSLIVVKSHIGFGSPKQDTAAAHGEPLGKEAVRATKQSLGWPLEPAFYVPEEARSHFRLALKRGEEAEARWNATLKTYGQRYPGPAGEFERALRRELPAGWEAGVSAFDPAGKPLATRTASGKVLNQLAGRLPNLIGGSADLAPSTKTLIEASSDFGTNAGRNLHFGVREFAMGAITNGLAMHGGLIPYGATFLVFSDYMRPAIRLAALMKSPSIFVFTHDSIALGGDGPTHQPVEQLMSLRLIPGLRVLRPADANETAACWKIAIREAGPAALLLTRQEVPVLDLSQVGPDRGPVRGAYLLRPGRKPNPDIVLIGTGSEVHLALEAARALEESGIDAGVVSMPCWEIFDEQPPEYREEVLPPHIPKLAIEAGATPGWERYTGAGGAVIGLDRFGASARGDIAYANLGFNVKNVVQRATRIVRG